MTGGIVSGCVNGGPWGLLLKQGPTRSLSWPSSNPPRLASEDPEDPDPDCSRNPRVIVPVLRCDRDGTQPACCQQNEENTAGVDTSASPQGVKRGRSMARLLRKWLQLRVPNDTCGNNANQNATSAC
jgi:hypothetical protein